MNNTYYVYAYLRNKDSKTAKAGTPYYIGKGTKYRFRLKHQVPIPKDRANIIFLERNLTDIGAIALERRMIAWYGRKDQNTGILLNRTAGGEGTSGRICTDEVRKKIQLANLGKTRSIETKLAISKSKTGIPRKLHSTETKLKMCEIQQAQRNIRAQESKDRWKDPIYREMMSHRKTRQKKAA